jgi:hypothetical protein
MFNALDEYIVDVFLYRLKLDIKVDKTFLEDFGLEATNVIRRVIAHTTNMFTWPSLIIPLHLFNYNKTFFLCQWCC